MRCLRFIAIIISKPPSTTHVAHIDAEKDKNASAGNRTRVDSLEGYNSTSKLLMLLMNLDKIILLFA